ncbi:TPA: hypothetical protein SLN68_001278 [Serratia marcescens]|uniref:HepT-like ribonuclease domain-containing protein n=1 Tax=Serratia TaxID=613 RepID=UPI000949BA3E|nr:MULTISPECIES: HepT-like ribonuclease domain-containing protein [Serratia]AVD63842.1 hypothetical protein C4B62_11745 [Serratia marcescens]ELL0332724.1 hypothetical protein [Serratia marcescens]MBH2550491.1 hypothetical protein [Serratia marcescens]MBH2861025.1 hypothetical protein [Serratia marcescens]MBH2993281.1 hypothetical protein [Serratia marcescens]
MKDARLVDYLSHMQQAAIAHGYFDINLEVVWATVQTALPELLTQLVAVRQDAEKLNDGD